MAALPGCATDNLAERWYEPQFLAASLRIDANQRLGEDRATWSSTWTCGIERSWYCAFQPGVVTGSRSLLAGQPASNRGLNKLRMDGR